MQEEVVAILRLAEEHFNVRRRRHSEPSLPTSEHPNLTRARSLSRKCRT
jgi:hypothetical protein